MSSELPNQNIHEVNVNTNNKNQNEINDPNFKIDENDSSQPFNASSNSASNSHGTSQEDSETRKYATSDIKFYSNMVNYSTYVYIVLIIGIILSILVLSLGISLMVKFIDLIGLLMLVFGIISALSFIWSCYSVKVFIAKCDEFLKELSISDPSKLAPRIKIEDMHHSWEQTYFNVMIFFWLFLSGIFSLFSIFAFALQTTTHYKLLAIAQDKKVWESYYGSRIFDSVYSNVAALLTISGISSLILCFYFIALLVFTYRNLKKFQDKQNLLHFICIVFMAAGLLLVYLGFMSMKFKDVSGVNQSSPTWVPEAILALGIVSVILASITYAGLWTQNITVLQAAVAVGLVTVAGSIILSVGGLQYSSMFFEYYENDCATLMDSMHKDYLHETFNCRDKYTFTTGLITNMQCPRNRILINWEVNEDKNNVDKSDSYGCLSLGCCYHVYSYIANTGNLMGIVGCYMVILSCITFGGAWYSVSKLEQNSNSNSNSNSSIKPSEYKYDQYIVLVLLGVVILVLFIFFLILPSKAVMSPDFYEKVSVVNPNNTQVNPVSIIQSNPERVIKRQQRSNDLKFSDQTMVQENKNGCFNRSKPAPCPELKYNYQLSTNDGVLLVIDNSVLPTVNQKNGTGWVLNFSGPVNMLKDFTKYFKYIPNCDLLPGKIDVKITADAFAPGKESEGVNSNSNSNNSLSFIEVGSKAINNNNNNNNYNNNNNNNKKLTRTTLTQLKTNVPVEIINYSSLQAGKTYDILNKSIDYSYVDTNLYQTLEGILVKTSKDGSSVPLANEEVAIKPLNFDTCPEMTMKTDSKGKFTSSPLYLFSLNMPVDYSLTAKVNGLAPHYSQFRVGGMALESMVNLGPIEMWDADLRQPAMISSVLIDSTTAKPVKNTLVKLYKGYKPVDNYMEFNRNRTTTIENIDSSYLVGNYTTSANGTFEFKHLVPDIYSLLITGGKFYFSEIRRKLYNII